MAEYSVTYREEGSFFKLKRVLRRRWPVAIATAVTVFAGVAAYTFTRPSIYESSTSLLVDINATRINDSQNKGANRSDRELVNVSTEIAILRSLALIESAVSRLKETQVTPIPTDFATQVANHLAVERENDAMVLRLTYRDPDRHRVPQVLRALTDAYSDYKLKDKRSQISYAVKTINAKLPQLKKKLEKSASEIAQFRKKNNISDPDTYAASVYEMKQGLERQEQELTIKIAESEKKFSELKQQVGSSTDVAVDKAILAQDTTYQNLVKQFQEAETSYYMGLTQYKEAHPAVRVLKDKRDRLYSLLQAQVQATLGSRSASVGVITDGNSDFRQTLTSQLFETQTAIAVQNAQLDSVRLAGQQVTAAFAQIPQLQQTYTELQRQYAFNSSLFVKFSERLEELRLEESQEIPSWRLMDRPSLPEYPTEPNILLNLVLGGVGGIVLALAAVLILEQSERRLREVDEVRELTDIPLLGTIPKIKTSPIYASNSDASPSGGIVPGYEHFAFMESLRSLAINLRYLNLGRDADRDLERGSEQPVKSIAFTSAVPAEGKSTLVYNLGCVLAELNYKVLVVDADLRRPTIHKLAGLSNGLGLSTAIATNLAWQQIVRSADFNSSPDLLTSGPVPPNPLVLLESAKMSNLLQVWHEHYDYILVDTPPIVGIADAQSLAAKVDAVVLVAAIQKSSRSAIARTVEILTNRHAHIAGILINMCDRQDSNDYYPDYASYYSESSLDGVTTAEIEPSLPLLGAASPDNALNDEPHDADEEASKGLAVTELEDV